MGIVDRYKKSMEDAQQAKLTIKNLSSDLPDKIYMLMMLDAHIQECERKIENLTSIGNSVQCSECQNWVLYEQRHTVKEIEGHTLCSTCCGTTSKVLMAQEAEDRWNLPVGTIKQDCRRGMLDQYIENGLVRKSGKYWLVSELVGKLYYEKRNRKSQKIAE